MDHRKTSTFALAVLVLAVAATGYAAPRGPLMAFHRAEELTADVVMYGNDYHRPDVFGPTGMAGLELADALAVTHIEAGSPADGIVRRNDVITAVNGQTLGAHPLKTLGQQVNPSEQTGEMKLELLRAGKKVSATVPIRKLGNYGSNWPFGCAKSAAILEDACRYLARHQEADGRVTNGIPTGMAMNGMLWLSSPNPAYLENARRLAYWYAREGFDSQANGTVIWGWGYMGIFLMEYYHRTGDEMVLPTCREIALTLARAQQDNGTWSHGPYPGKGYVAGGSLNAAGAAAWTALLMFDEAGVPVPRATLAKATAFFSRFPDNGTIPYGDHRPEFASTGNSKDSLTCIGFSILGDAAKTEILARQGCDAYQDRCKGHTGGFLGFVWGNIAALKQPHRPDWRRMTNHWRWLLDVSRRWDGGWHMSGSLVGGNYADRGPTLPTGGVGLLFGTPGTPLRIMGAPKSVFATPTRSLPPKVGRAVKYHRSLQFDKVRKTLKSNSSAAAKQLLAAAEQKAKDIDLSLARARKALADGDAPLALTIVRNLDGYCLGASAAVRELRGKVLSGDHDSVLLAAKQYNKYRGLTYVYPEARKVFIKLAEDNTAGLYQKLTREELATPMDDPKWNYSVEALWDEHFETREIDPRSWAAFERIARTRGGNWPQWVAYDQCRAKGIFDESFIKRWTAICPHGTTETAKAPQWRALLLGPDDAAPPDGWAATNFDDSKWSPGVGTLTRENPKAPAIPRGSTGQYIRIAFDAKHTDFEAVRIYYRNSRDRMTVFLNGKPVAWVKQPRQKRYEWFDLATGARKLLRKGRNVLAIHAKCDYVDLGLYGRTGPDKADAFTPPAPADHPIRTVKMPAPSATLSAEEPPTPAPAMRMSKTGITFDPPGRPNEDFHDIRTALTDGTMPMADRPKYFGHFSPVVRRMAAFSLLHEGKKAMPLILKALNDKDPRVIRAGTDALSGAWGFSGRTRREQHKIMTPEITAPAAPLLAELLDHDNVYVREGVLLALSNCGDAALPYLPKIAKCLDDPEWWVRAAVTRVFAAVGVDKDVYAAVAATSYRAEKSTFARGGYLGALVAMAKAGKGIDPIVAALIAEMKGPDEHDAGKALAALASIGPAARAAIPAIDKKAAAAKSLQAAARTDKLKQRIQRRIDALAKARERIGK